MKRHLTEVRHLSLCAAIAGICVLGVPAQTLAADEAQAKVSFSANQSNTFLTNIVSGGAANKWADRTSWESVFRFGQPSLFGGMYLSSLPVSRQIEGAGTLSGSTASQVKPASLGVIKLGGGTLRVTGGTTTSVQIQGATISGGVLTVAQPLSEPTVSGPAGGFESSVITGSAIITSAPVSQPSSQDASPSAPSRRPKPPLPPGPSVVSR